jgi:cell division protease FtsH
MGSKLGPVSFPRDGASPAAQLGLPSTSPALAEEADHEVLRILKQAEEVALTTLGDHRAALEALAKALIEHETVEKNEVEAIVAAAERDPAGKTS